MFKSLMFGFGVLVTILISQIGVGIYQLGCWHWYNRFFDRLNDWFVNWDVDEFLETVVDTMIIGFGIITVTKLF